MFTKFDEFVSSLNEAKFAGKRKYTEQHPAINMSTAAPIRNKVLEFINSKKIVSRKELLEFFDQMSETLGKKPSTGWLSKNGNLIEKFIDENGETSYTLTKRGKRVLEMTKRLMENEEIEEYINSNEDLDEDLDENEISQDTIKALLEKTIVPQIEINTEKAEEECERNKFAGEITVDFKDLVLTFGEPAIRQRFKAEWYLYDRKSKVSYLIKNKDGVRYKQARGVPFEVWTNVSKGFDAANYIQDILDVNIEWVRVGENNEETFIAKKSIND